jgi:Transglycosylase SLT domain
MRHLLVPACLCLMALPGPAGKQPSLASETFSDAVIVSKKQFISRAAPETTQDLEAVASAIDESTRDKSQNDDDATSVESASTAFEPGGVLDSDDSIVPFPPPMPPRPKPVVERSREEICDAVTREAQANDVPAPFFIRLLFQESGFQSGMWSDAGAEGIAQFMRETSADVGLDNPYDPLQAIPAAARLLRNLAHEFGNLGLAAAAYNAGPKRIQDWLARKGKLPQETQGYVRTITGRAPETFTAAAKGSPAVKLPRQAPCQEAAGLLAWDGPERIPLPPVYVPAKKAETKAARTDTADAKDSEAPDGKKKSVLDRDKTAKITAGKPKATSAKTVVAEAKPSAKPAEKSSSAPTPRSAIAQVAAAKRKHGHKVDRVAQN